jgi:hypothetical protein
MKSSPSLVHHLYPEVILQAFPPVGAIYTGIGVLLSAAKDTKTSHDALVELFERLVSFFNCLGVYPQVSLTTEMTDAYMKIVSEVLSILSIATKEVKRKRARMYFRKLLGRTDLEDALAGLERLRLMNEGVLMAIPHTIVLKTVNDKTTCS